jgi:hypothetical protein
VFLKPLFAPVAICLVAAAIGYIAFRGARRDTNGYSVAATSLLVVVGSLAALVPVSGQLFYDIGVPWLAGEAAEHLSFAVAGFCFGAAWRLVAPSLWRWALLPLFATSLARPAITSFTYYIWDTRGFGP